MKETIKKIEDLQQRVRETWQILDLDTVETEIKVLEAEMATEDFWQDQDNAKGVSQKASGLREGLETWRGLQTEIDDLLELANMSQKESDQTSGEQIEKDLDSIVSRFEKLEFHILFQGEYDKEDAIVSIHAGTGGTEAQDWAEMLLRMLMRFCESRGWVTHILDESRGGEAGIKSVTFRVAGRYAFGYLKSEAGVHRLVRISPFDAESMRHTSFALIEVLPELKEAHEIDIDPKDLRIDTFMASGHGGQSVNTTYSAIRIVHKPTNISVSCQNERSQQQNKETALKILKAKLHQKYLAEQAEKKQELRGEYSGAEWGNQIRSYVLHPYKMVKDHRTDYESPDPDKVLDGELDSFIEAYLRKVLEDSDRFAESNVDSHR